MLNPFSTWIRLAEAAADMSRTALQAASTIDASRDIVARRTTMMADAMRSPMRGDYAELSRMVPEKVEALSESFGAVAGEVWLLHQRWIAEMQNLGTVMARGRAPTAGEWNALATRGAALAVDTATRTAGLGARGLAPIARKVAGNAQRLRAKPAGQRAV